MQKRERALRQLTSPQVPRPGIQTSTSYLRNALAPSSSVGISSTLEAGVRAEHT
jgi:hypothetical protein